MATFATKPSGPCTKGFPIGCLVVGAAAMRNHGARQAFAESPGTTLGGFLFLAAIAYVVCRVVDAVFFSSGTTHSESSRFIDNRTISEPNPTPAKQRVKWPVYVGIAAALGLVLLVVVLRSRPSETAAGSFLERQRAIPLEKRHYGIPVVAHAAQAHDLAKQAKKEFKWDYSFEGDMTIRMSAIRNGNDPTKIMADEKRGRVVVDALNRSPSAHLDESYRTFVNQYGQPAKVTNTGATSKWARFTFHDMAVYASFDSERCVEVTYLNVPPLALTTLLQLNGGKSKWVGQERNNGEEIAWVQQGGASAILNLAFEPNEITFRSPEAERLGAQRHPWRFRAGTAY